MTDAITMDRMTAAMFVANALSVHFAGYEDDDGCCPECCAPCKAVRDLVNSDQLDDILRGTQFGAGWDYWDDENDQVNRALLGRTWRMEECHSLIMFDVNGIEDVANVQRDEKRTFWCEVEGLPGCFATGRTSCARQRSTRSGW